MCSHQIATASQVSASARALTLCPRLRYTIQQPRGVLPHHTRLYTTRFAFSVSPSSSALLLRAPSIHTRFTTPPLFTQSRNMFGRAIKSHDSSRPTASAISPSSQKTTQTSIKNAFSSSSSSRAAAAPLRPPTQNAQRQTESSSSSTQKRQISSGLASVFNPNSAFQENIPPQVDLGNPPDSMQSLHDAVYFDEADFDDECDLDFDLSEPIINPALSAAAAALPTPPDSLKSQPMFQKPPPPPSPPPPARRPKDTYDDLDFGSRLPGPKPPSPRIPDSSQPLPWSSSPPSHLEPPKRRSDPVEDAPPQTKKRRTIPWATAKTEVEEEVSAPIAKVKNPASKVGPSRRIPSDSMPWNDSFSNVEAGRKEARKRNSAKQQKRSLTTMADDAELMRKVKKGREPIAKIFLSEEQKRVVDLVVTGGQSVFFTGSAGGYIGIASYRLC
jgi:hypothetical protein